MEVHEILMKEGLKLSKGIVYQYHAAYVQGKSTSAYVNKTRELDSKCFGYLEEMGLNPVKWQDAFYMKDCGFLKFFDFLTNPEKNPINEDNPAILLLEMIAGYNDANEKLAGLLKAKERKGLKFVGTLNEGLMRYNFIAKKNGIRELTEKGNVAIETLKRYGILQSNN